MTQMELPISTSAFLRDYWQQKPLLIRNAVPNFLNPLSPQELAGLAMEADVESRIISNNSGQWSLKSGPFHARDYDGEGLWTLLVQRVDELIPEVRDLRQLAGFLPSWRLDDVMVSYAVDGAGVGPHFDRYDVFLLQGLGQRRWSLGPMCDDDTPTIESDGLSLLHDFDSEEEFVLNPGDALYVPPGVAHWGTAIGECMTYSIGFRAPPISVLAARLTDHVLERISDTLLLADQSSVEGKSRAGEITASQLDNARQAVINAFNALDTGEWLLELLSESGEDPITTSEPVSSLMALRSDVRLVWHRAENTPPLIFADGEQVVSDVTDIELLSAIAEGQVIDVERLDSRGQDLIEALADLGIVEAISQTTTH